ncbi:mCG1041514 [Mus musculus]|nr:mCG1041514 [Mus musculus]
MASEIAGLGSTVGLRRGIFLDKFSPKKPKHPPLLKPQTYQHFILDVSGKK